jgi:hypothetical protein
MIDDFWSNWWNENWQGKPKYSEKPTPAPLCPPQNRTWQTQSRSPDRSGGKPATNRLSYGAAYFSPNSPPLTTRRVTVEVFDSASTRVKICVRLQFNIIFAPACPETSFCIETRLRAGRPRNRSSIPQRGKRALPQGVKKPKREADH